MDSFSNVIYRRSVARDAEAVFQLLATSVRNLAPIPYPQEVIDTWMSGVVVEDRRDECAEQRIWIAELANIPVGFAQAIPGEIKRLFVDADQAGRGIGTDLMERALKDALPYGAGTVKIMALLNAVPFYKKWGFQEINRTVMPDREEGLPPIDVINMAKVF